MLQMVQSRAMSNLQGRQAGGSHHLKHQKKGHWKTKGHQAGKDHLVDHLTQTDNKLAEGDQEVEGDPHSIQLKMRAKSSHLEGQGVEDDRLHKQEVEEDLHLIQLKMRAKSNHLEGQGAEGHHVYLLGVIEDQLLLD